MVGARPVVWWLTAVIVCCGILVWLGLSLFGFTMIFQGEGSYSSSRQLLIVLMDVFLALGRRAMVVSLSVLRRPPSGVACHSPSWLSSARSSPSSSRLSASPISCVPVKAGSTRPGVSCLPTWGWWSCSPTILGSAPRRLPPLSWSRSSCLRACSATAEPRGLLRQVRRRRADARGTRSRRRDVDLNGGTLIVAQNFNRTWQRLKGQQALAIRLRDLRHSHVTQLVAAGAHVKLGSERVGHASVGITPGRLRARNSGSSEEAAEKIDAGLRTALAG